MSRITYVASTYVEEHYDCIGHVNRKGAAK
eukprot:SAG11_NODE_2052_length_3879_cov_2.030159_6_plen_30_part_00